MPVRGTITTRFVCTPGAWAVRKRRTLCRALIETSSSTVLLYYTYIVLLNEMRARQFSPAFPLSLNRSIKLINPKQDLYKGGYLYNYIASIIHIYDLRNRVYLLGVCFVCCLCWILTINCVAATVPVNTLYRNNHHYNT